MYICNGLVLNLPPENKPWNVNSNLILRNLKNLDIEESIKCKKLIYTENWFDKIDRFVIYIFFSFGFISPFLVYFDPYRNSKETGIEYYLLFILSVFFGYSFYRKATEKQLTEIKSKFEIEQNRKLINNYCAEKGFEKYRNSINIIIYNSENDLSFNSNYKISRIFLLDNHSIYITMIKENHKLNIPVLFSQIFLRKDIEKIVQK